MHFFGEFLKSGEHLLPKVLITAAQKCHYFIRGLLGLIGCKCIKLIIISRSFTERLKRMVYVFGHRSQANFPSNIKLLFDPFSSLGFTHTEWSMTFKVFYNRLIQMRIKNLYFTLQLWRQIVSVLNAASSFLDSTNILSKNKQILQLCPWHCWSVWAEVPWAAEHAPDSTALYDWLCSNLLYFRLRLYCGVYRYSGILLVCRACSRFSRILRLALLFSVVDIAPSICLHNTLLFSLLFSSFTCTVHPWFCYPHLLSLLQM